MVKHKYSNQETILRSISLLTCGALRCWSDACLQFTRHSREEGSLARLFSLPKNASYIAPDKSLVHNIAFQYGSQIRHPYIQSSKVVMVRRPQSEAPWSLSALSQLTEIRLRLIPALWEGWAYMGNQFSSKLCAAEPRTISVYRTLLSMDGRSVALMTYIIMSNILESF